MSSKDDYIFEKRNLLRTPSGRKILKNGIVKDKGYNLFRHYLTESKSEYIKFVRRYKDGIYQLIISDLTPIETHNRFLEEVGDSLHLRLNKDKLLLIGNKMRDEEVVFDRIDRILNSNFVKMTFPVFYALYDGFESLSGQKKDSEIRNNVIDGHLIAIDLSEPMDRILDKDEDLDYLEDYKFLNPYIL